ncbi:ThiF family adenylyltransferase [Sinorhizobium garamanticum]|uniref:ThiF family adenylyltransferase n=1 Tax=Sinorhizobium garamanticum TaxID=680247 RepID=A0ABY8D4N2_9HYPH|nr:ThiF family adenylyltransferase [Sinorhizobium garamanticum]WEX85816.1 ThiF family adenylyltransferase [Sinorhizobium garamanticum]
MSWWLTNASRAKSEQVALAQLAEGSGWLSGVSWRIGDDLHLIVDFDIQHNGETFSLFMAYPSTFPDTPPMVRSRDGKRLSWHQYGAEGELCLEHRPDNWDPSITGAMMVESAYRLLSGERPTGDEDGVVRSAHQTSIGREVRGELVRFVIAGDAIESLAGLPMDVPVPITAWDRLEKPTWIASLVSVGDEGSMIWSQSAPQPSGSSMAKGFALRTTRDVERFRTDPRSFVEALPAEFPELAERLPENPFNGFVLLGGADRWTALNLFAHDDKQTVFHYKTIVEPEASGRLSADYGALVGKRIAIIGCGSVGSKIAATLARSGVRKFTLVDDDIFFQANLVRNDLDARAIGRHKVDALTVRIKDIVANAEVDCRRVALGQQESAGTTESVMEELAQADLLIDATADPRAFNLVAAVARRHRKPMVWCEVFAGGIGGVVARMRPDLDPIPTLARSQIRAWCDGHGVPWAAGTNDADYGVQSSDGSPLVADDADVSVIAGHASRLALDILTREQSIFPSSAYAIGLAAEWIFQAPFDTWPIDLRPEGEWGESQEAASVEDLKDLLTTLFPEAAA